MSTTIKDVAKLAGVSTTLVSYVVNGRPVSIPEETRRKVLDAVESLHYVPSAAGRGLRNRRSRVIAELFLHYEPSTILADPYTAGTTLSLVDYLAPRGYYYMSYTVPDGQKNQRELVEFLSSGRADGLIVQHTCIDDPYLDLIASSGLPFVAMYQPSCRHESSALVNLDDAGGIRLTVEHLIERGHRRIGHLQGYQRSYGDRLRRETFEEVLREHGLEVHEEWIRGDGSCTVEDGFRSMGEMLDLAERPTAIAATSDLLAIGAVKQLKSRGLRIPEDMAITGFDDILAASLLEPALTTVSLSYRSIGEAEGEQVLRLIESPGERPPIVTIPASLIVRGSTATQRVS
jgi:LacI family transcriptional regulator